MQLWLRKHQLSHNAAATQQAPAGRWEWKRWWQVAADGGAAQRVELGPPKLRRSHLLLRRWKGVCAAAAAIAPRMHRALIAAGFGSGLSSTTHR